MKLIKTILSGGDVFVGRGGMRGGRRINEDECRITKLPGATKKGDSNIRSIFKNLFYLCTVLSGES